MSMSRSGSLVFPAGLLIGECPGPGDNSQHLRDVLITTCHPQLRADPIAALRECRRCLKHRKTSHKSERRVKRQADDNPPFAGPQSCWRSFHQRCRFWTSCRRPCSWWWAGGRRSAVAPSSRLMPSGWVAGSSCPLGHCCTLTYKKKEKEKAQQLEIRAKLKGRVD